MAKDFRKERNCRFQIRMYKTKSVNLLLQVQPATAKSLIDILRQRSFPRNDVDVKAFEAEPLCSLKGFLFYIGMEHPPTAYTHQPDLPGVEDTE